MHWLCAVRGHRRVDDKRSDGEYYHSRCRTCGKPIVRYRGTSQWRLPTDEESAYFRRFGGSLLAVDRQD